MKTITVKLPDKEARELDKFVMGNNYPSKSEFIRNLLMERIETRLTARAMKDINKSIKEIKEGKTISLDEIEEEYGI